MGRVFACADLHGRYDLYLKIKEFIQPEDKVIFLGDATDRGPHSWRLMKAILNDKQWEYLCGNHEDMLAKAIREYYDSDGYSDSAWMNLATNGGSGTFEGWLNDGAHKEWAEVFESLPHWTGYVNQNGYWVILSHAGFTPWRDEDDNICIPDRYSCLWDRHHFDDPWDEENFAATMVVHGHTPIPYMLYTNQEQIDRWDDPKPYYYADGHKVNIDCGACWIKKTVLLDLDTFDYYVIDPKDIPICNS